jgi:circadian clock protein KaiC
MPTGIPGLDGLVEGGLPRGGIYLVAGPPGSGKTILANQICFHHASQGQHAVYVSLLSESHEGMLSHLARLGFYREDLVGQAVVYYSGYKVLKDDGADGLGRLLGKILTEQSPAVLVVDGLTTASTSASSGTDLKQLVRQVQTYSASVGCTTLLLTSVPPGSAPAPEHTVVDGIVEVSDDRQGLRSLRHLEVCKLRGTRQVRGRHSLEISDAGVTVHPRFESIPPPEEAPSASSTARCSAGVPELDRMMGGGMRRGSMTVVLGPSGTGKTTLLLRFLAEGAARGEVGLFFGMGERQDALLAKDRELKLGVQAGVDAGLIHLAWQRAPEGVLDMLATKLIRQLRETRATLLCIDGLYSLVRTIDYPARIREVTAALAEQLTALGITTMGALETPDLVEPPDGLRVPVDDLSAMAHNLIVLRTIEREDRFEQVLAVIKMRDSDHDRSMRALRITEGGIELKPLRGVAQRGQRPHPARR